MKDRETPLRLVRLWAKLAPDAFATLDMLASAKDQIGWPDYCPLPIGAAFTYLVERQGATIEEAAAGAAELVACWSWRKNKVIYRFDNDLANILNEQVKEMGELDILPTELLIHLPYPCIYVQTHIFDGLDGFWAWIEYDVNEQHLEFRVQWVNMEKTHSLPYSLHLLPGKTLQECILDTFTFAAKHSGAEIIPQAAQKDDAAPILPALQLVLYLLSQNAEVDEVVPMTIKKEKDRYQIIHDKAGEVRELSVGVRIGAAIRKYNRAVETTGRKVQKPGTTKRPHSRRGHWHHYWTGPQGNRKLILKWTAPTFIHMDAKSEDDVVIFPVD